MSFSATLKLSIINLVPTVSYVQVLAVIKVVTFVGL
jgi:hypothetical protein